MPGLKIFTKIYYFSRNKINEGLERLHFIERRKKTKALRISGKSDLKRWENSKELDESWDERTYIIASMIEPNSSIIEFGAGNMKLRNKLPENCTYQASDIISRYPGVIACDLNQEILIDLSKYDTAIFSGVLEYVYDVKALISRLTEDVEKIILSYACRDISNAPRLDRGWLSDYSREELEKIFTTYNYEILQYREWRNQSIFSLRLKKLNQ